MAPESERITQLEAAVADLQARLVAATDAPMAPSSRRRPRFLRRLALIGLALAMVIPAGGALASHRFNDVPTSHQFHTAISAIADAGVTTGCSQGTNNYCPDGLVTRGQMAAFMSRLGALSPGSAPKVNADRLDGLHANGLTRVASMSSTTLVNILNNTTNYQFGPDLVITAPAAGFVTVNAGVTFRTPDCTDVCFAYAHVRHVQSNATSIDTGAYATADHDQASGSIHRVFPVNAGVNTFRVEIHRTGTEGIMRGHFVSATALYTPFGSTGGSTLAQAEAAEHIDPLTVDNR